MILIWKKLTATIPTKHSLVEKVALAAMASMSKLKRLAETMGLRRRFCCLCFTRAEALRH